MALRLIILTALFFIGTPSYANVCERTKEVVGKITNILNKKCDQISPSDLGKIRRFSLEHQEIKMLKEGDFDGFSQLEDLDLHRNKLSEIPSGLFKDLTTLRWVRLDQNQLRQLPLELFQNLYSLQTLNVSRNPMSLAEKQRIQSEVFSPLTKVYFKFRSEGLNH